MSTRLRSQRATDEAQAGALQAGPRAPRLSSTVMASRGAASTSYVGCKTCVLVEWQLPECRLEGLPRASPAHQPARVRSQRGGTEGSHPVVCALLYRARGPGTCRQCPGSRGGGCSGAAAPAHTFLPPQCLTLSVVLILALGRLVCRAGGIVLLIIQHAAWRGGKECLCVKCAKQGAGTTSASRQVGAAPGGTSGASAPSSMPASARPTALHVDPARQ